jgi:uncharacterized protein (TIGR00266 family)
MQVTIRHSPSNAIARCALEGGEVLKVQPDAMVAHSSGVVLSAGADGGVMKGLKRKVLGGESFFITTYTAPSGGVATHLLGDQFSLDLSEGHGLLISRGGWVASSTEIAIDAKWGGLKNLMGGEGGFIVRASGHGTIVMACFGALDVWDLADGETFVLDTNHMVAYDESVNYKLRRAVEGRSIQSMKSGEGWVFEFTGPGRVYGQTRSPQSLTKWLEQTLTLSSGSATGGGALGSLLTR